MDSIKKDLESALEGARDLVRNLESIAARVGAASSQPGDEVAVHQDPGGNTGALSLVKVCDEMYRQGYRYASLERDNNLKHNPRHPTGVSVRKPGNAAYFSKLIQDADDEHQVIPDWYSWLEWNMRDRMDAYKHSDLIFAKYDEARIIKQDNPALRRPPYFKPNAFMGAFDWVRISADWAGILVDTPERDMEPFGGWDVETLAVWNYDALRDVKRFSFSGGDDFTYKPQHT